MKKLVIYLVIFLVVTTACEDFLDPEQGLVISEDQVPKDEVELRSLSLGLYSLQQDLVDQIVVLGELRADLLRVTDNADQDLREIYNFQISESNRYASPANFYKLISACNILIRILEHNHPEVLDKSSPISNYHRMYGEAIAMRSWAYFYAVRIFNEIPYIPETLTTIEKITAYVNSPGSYTDSVYIYYSPNGIDSYTVYDTTFVYTEKKFLNQDQMTRRCIQDILEKVRVVGVDYSNRDQVNDVTLNTTVWNEDALKALLVQMYMHIDNYTDALDILTPTFLRRTIENVGEIDIKYALDDRFAGSNWINIFNSIDNFEHIFTVQFQKTTSSWQLNNLQRYFSIIPPNIYAMKPTPKAIRLWESQWRNYSINTTNPDNAFTVNPGIPGDFSRGYGRSYIYVKNGVRLDVSTVTQMLNLKRLGFRDEVNDIMQGVDTVAFKYTIGKNPFDRNANFIVYRAAAMHLYTAELLANRQYMDGNSPRHDLNFAEHYIYTGDYMSSNDRRRGVAGRAGFSQSTGKAVSGSRYYIFDPDNNEIIGYNSIATTLQKQLYMEDIIMDERARELAFEGERFYDYVRMARRRERAGNNGIEWLADKISGARPANERAAMKAQLMNENNWYLPFILR
jgi:starch-binding outer membrane protein, SusD/RagB family